MLDELRGCVSRLIGGGGGGEEGLVRLLPAAPSNISTLKLIREEILEIVFPSLLSEWVPTPPYTHLISAWVGQGQIQLQIEMMSALMVAVMTRASLRNLIAGHSHWYRWEHCSPDRKSAEGSLERGGTGWGWRRSWRYSLVSAVLDYLWRATVSNWSSAGPRNWTSLKHWKMLLIRKTWQRILKIRRGLRVVRNTRFIPSFV